VVLERIKDEAFGGGARGQWGHPFGRTDQGVRVAQRGEPGDSAVVPARIEPEENAWQQFSMLE
jgi:hypothetical protein